MSYLIEEPPRVHFGDGYRGVSLQIGDRLIDFWWRCPDPLDVFVGVLGWLSWVANGCRILRVTEVDRERGLITIEVENGLP